MAYPTLAVEVAFSTDPGATPTWTDITAWVMSLESIESGRDSELVDSFPAGRCSLVLSNIDRRFEPEYASSPYYPNVIPMRRLRIRATYNAVTYDLFAGYVERWPVEYEDPSEATVRITAVDGLAALAQAPLPGSVYELEVRADSPVAWWRLGESSGTVALDSIGNTNGTYEGGATFNSRAGLIKNESNTAIYFGAGQDVRLANGSSLVTAYPFSIECWFQAETVTVGGPAAMLAIGVSLATPDSNQPSVGLWLDYDTGKLALTVISDSGAIRQVVTTARLDDSQVHHAVAVATSATDFKLYVDGALAAVTTPYTGSPTVPTLSYGWALGNSIFYSVYNQPLKGVLDEVAIYNVALSATRVTAHYNAAKTPWANDLSGTRVGKVLDAVSWSAADRSIDAGQSTLRDATLGGTALAHLQAVARTEAGALYMTPDGKVRFRDRHTPLKAPATTSQATYGDASGELAYSDIVPSYDVDRVRNVVRRGRSGGSVVEVSDATSKARYYTRSDEQTDLLTVSDLEVRDNADWTLQHRKDPALRFDELVVEPYGDDANQWPQMLGRKIGDRITVRRRPPGGGAMVERVVVIEGIRHRYGGPLRWSTAWRLSPAEADYWILGTSTLGTSTRLGF